MYVENNQVYSFFVFILIGVILTVLFDLFRILRKSFNTSDIITFIEDIAYWIISGFILIYSIFIFNNGEIRLYIFLGIGIGVLIYLEFASKIFIRLNVSIIKFIKKITNQIIKIIIIPINRVVSLLRKIILKPISIICINLKTMGIETAKLKRNFFKSKKKKIVNNKV